MKHDSDVQEMVLAEVLPDWPLPLSFMINPLVTEADERHRRWLREYSLADIEDEADPMLKLDAAHVAAKAYPRADTDTLTLAAGWTAWFFHFDDYFDEGVLGTSQVLAQAATGFVTSGPSESASRLSRRQSTLLLRTRSAFDDLRDRTRCVMSPTQFEIFNDHLEAYFTALGEEALNREKNIPISVDEYCSLRRFTGPALPLLDLIEHAEGLRLPQSFYRSGQFDLLLNSVADLASWINDIFSVGKEKARGDMHNLVLVIERAEGISVTDAACRAAQRIRRHLDLVDTAERDLLRQESDICPSAAARSAIEGWIDGLRSFLHHSDWYIRHARYTTAGGPR